MGDDARIEARGSKNEVRASRFYSRVSIRASTTTNVGSLPLPLDETHFLIPLILIGDNLKDLFLSFGPHQLLLEGRVFQ